SAKVRRPRVSGEAPLRLDLDRLSDSCGPDRVHSTMSDHRLLQPLLRAAGEEVEHLDHRALPRRVRADEYGWDVVRELQLHIPQELEILPPEALRHRRAAYTPRAPPAKPCLTGPPALTLAPGPGPKRRAPAREPVVSRTGARSGAYAGRDQY